MEVNLPPVGKVNSEDWMNDSGSGTEAVDIPDMLVAIFRYLTLPERHALRGVSCLWKICMDSAAVSRSANFDENLLRADAKVPLLDQVRYLSRCHYDHLTTLCIHCATADDWSIHGEIGSVVVGLSSLSFALVPRLRTLVLHSGKLSSYGLKRWLCLDRAPRILLRDIAFYPGENLMRGISGMHVWVKSADLDPSQMLEVVELSEQERRLWQTVYGHRQNNPALQRIWRLLADELDRIPLEKADEMAILEIVGSVKSADEYQVRSQLSGVLHAMDRKFFSPSMLTSRDGIQIAPSVLRKATLHLFRAVMMDLGREKYTCTELKCLQKH